MHKANRPPWSLPVLVACCLLWLFVAKAQPDQLVDFGSDLAPMFEKHCIRCHKPGNERGDVSLATIDDLAENGYIAPGDPDGSYLLDIVSARDDGQPPEMPKEGEPLAESDLRLLRAWIEAGASWPADVQLRERSQADESWWSLQPVVASQPPRVPQAPAAWQDHPVDRFIYAALTEKGLQPAPRATRRELIRRATYDLWGLPPTPTEIQAFVNDTSPDAWAKLIDRLLESPRYGERWGRHWLDVVRFGESRGFERNQIVDNAWPFRDYIIRSLNEDRPFDQLIREHLAADVMNAEDPDREVATTFLVCGPYDDVGNQDAKQAAQIRANTIDEMIRATSEAFLGLTIGCARCHDHKFDPVVQTDYYGMYATFAGVHHGEREVATAEEKQQRRERLAPLEQERKEREKEIDAIEKEIDARAAERAEKLAQAWTRPPVQRTGTEETFAPTAARYVRLTVEGTENNPQGRTGYRIDEFEVWTTGKNARNAALESLGGRAQGASRVANDFADAYSARLTIDGNFGARWIAAGSELTVEFPREETVRRVFFSSDRKGDAGDHSVAAFVSEYRIETSLNAKDWTQVAGSHDRQPINDAHRRHRLREAVITANQRAHLADLRREVAKLQQQIRAVPALPVWWIGNFKQPQGPYHVFLGGDPQRKGPKVRPASLSTLDRITQPFALPDDSAEGERRRALADWIVAAENPLTRRVLANRVWHYHFGTGIVDTPSDFGFMGSRPTHPKLLDWLAAQTLHFSWRLKPLHRLILLSQTYQQSSEFRPAAARVDADSRYVWRFPPRRLSAEEIRDTLLYVSGRLDTTVGGRGFRLYRYIQDNVATYIPLDQHGPETYRRAVYHQNARSSPVDLMSEFDCPDPSFAAPRRTSTTTPLQALTLLNHQFTLDMSQAMAERIEKEADDDAPARVRRTFQLALGRLPDSQEQSACAKLVGKHGLKALCRVLLNSNEFIYVP